MLVNNIQHRTTFTSTEFDIKNTDIKRCFGDRKKFNCRKPGPSKQIGEENISNLKKLLDKIIKKEI